MKIDLVEIEDLEDGGAIIKFDLDPDAMKYFARVGLEYTLMSALEEDAKKNKEPADE